MMPRRLSRFAAAAALMLPAVALAQAAAPVPVAPAMPALNPAEFRTLIDAAVKAGQADDCPALLGLLDPALPRIAAPERLTVQMLRVVCLGRSRGGEIPALYADVAAIDPANPAVRRLGVLVATQAGSWQTAGERLAGLAEAAPKELAAVNGMVVQAILQGLAAEKRTPLRERLLVAMAKTDWTPADMPDMRDGLAQGAIDAQLAAGNVEDAKRLLARVAAPELLAGMAMERHYAPIWPEIEVKLGPNGGDAVDSFAGPRLDAFANSPPNTKATRDAVRAFVLLGRYQDAVDTARPIVVADGLDDNATVTLRYEAQALSALGMRDAAIERLRPFATLDLAKNPYAASAIVTYAELLQEAQRPADALAVSRTLLGDGAPRLSPWGAAWLRRSELCALSSLKRTAEARAAADALIVAADVNRAAAIEGLLCAGRGDDAAKIAVPGLRTREGANQLADQFQPADALWGASDGSFRALWTGFLARPDVKAAFEGSARILPRTLRPARSPRDIPRAASPTGPIA